MFNAQYRFDMEDSYYEPDHFCSKCDYKDEVNSEVCHFFQGILDQLYGKDQFDPITLEHCLDEVCRYLQMKSMDGDIKVMPKQETKILCPKWLNKFYENKDQLKTA